MDIKEHKKSIRQEMLARRDQLEKAGKTMLDEELCSKIKSTILERNAKIIHSYLPFGSEPDIYPVIQELLDEGYTVVCPKSLAKRTIQNLVLTSLHELEEGRFGTRHPAGNNEYTGNIDLYIVPGVAFDGGNYRLGYGSGYYDAWFTAHPGGHKLGICYPWQYLAQLPNEPHDFPLDEVLY